MFYFVVATLVQATPVRVSEEYSAILVGLGVVGLLATILIYFIQQNIERRDRILRSTEAILREIKENKKALSGEVHERMTYIIGEQQGEIKEVNFTNAYLETDAYDSVLHSGFFIHFSVGT